jgi:pyruvate-formate lyase-activating enzyme
MTIPLVIERAVVEINGGCNYKCQMCPQSIGREKQFLKTIPLTEFERVVAELSQYGLKLVNLEGSGEPTLQNNLDEYIKVVTKYGAKPFIYTNGFRMKGDLMKRCVDAGLAFCRFSVIGYSREKYREWMKADNFEIIVENAGAMNEYAQGSTTVASYHLILGSDTDYEIDQYVTNFITPARTQAEIWKMHNWSGVYDNPTKRMGNRKTCGRPFAPEITIRAGGPNKLSVAPCCQTLGQDTIAVLGNLTTQTVEQIWNGQPYEQLRQAHSEKMFDSIPYCSKCDFLYDDQSVLVYSNTNTKLFTMNGTTFSLDDFRN